MFLVPWVDIVVARAELFALPFSLLGASIPAALKPSRKLNGSHLACPFHGWITLQTMIAWFGSLLLTLSYLPVLRIAITEVGLLRCTMSYFLIPSSEVLS